MALCARDVMQPQVITVRASMDVREAAKLLLSKGITGAPVTDERGALVGVLSQRDLVFYQLTRDDELVMDSTFYQSARVEGHHIPAGFQIEDCNSGTVADVMTPVVHTVSLDATIKEVSRVMIEEHIHRVIVRDGQRVAGIISALDLLRVNRL